MCVKLKPLNTRLYIKKQNGFDVKTDVLQRELNQLGVSAKIKVYSTYDIFNTTDEELKIIIPSVFTDPVIEECLFELPIHKQIIAIEYLPGQFDLRADAAMQCCQLLLEHNNTYVQTSQLIGLDEINDEDINIIKKHLINTVDSREKDLLLLEKPMVQEPASVMTIDGFINFDKSVLESFLKSNRLSIDIEDLICIQNYFIGEKRNPTITEIKVLETYWSDHCRHTNFLTHLNNIKFEGAYKNKIEKLPVVNKSGKLVGLITFGDILKLKSHPNAVKDNYGRLLVSAGVGITDDLLQRVEALYHVGVDIICLDSAHGHTMGVIESLKKIKKSFKSMQVIAGNVGTGAGALALANAGADAIKVGIGPGSICTTRIVAGTGMPQITAIMEVAAALKNKKIGIISDGGIRYTGDLVKAIAAGATTVMMGNIFAGTEESPGETIIYEGRKFKQYRGMGSLGAMAEGSSDRYFQENQQDTKKFVPEGIEGRVAFKGNVKEVIHQFTGGLRAGMGYCGASNISMLQESKFVRITQAGNSESHAHDIFITKEAPNYSR